MREWIVDGEARGEAEWFALSRLGCALALTKKWLQHALEYPDAQPGEGSWLRRSMWLADAALDGARVSPEDASRERPWEAMIAFEGVQKRALEQGPSSKAAHWIACLPGYDKGLAAQGAWVMQNHSHVEMGLAATLDAAWRAAEMYCFEQSPYRELGRDLAMAANARRWPSPPSATEIEAMKPAWLSEIEKAKLEDLVAGKFEPSEPMRL